MHLIHFINIDADDLVDARITIFTETYRVIFYPKTNKIIINQGIYNLA